MPKRRGKVRAPVPRATFPCALCRDAGRVVTLEAELEPEPPLLIVTDLQGGCACGGVRRAGGATHFPALGLIAGRVAWRLSGELAPVPKPSACG
jgi:hypothetical protein